ncbi:hypothetical protein U9M48_042176 [Paspalum notatum var. saurae]|uniref:Reverse transcriptase domain-containing protein n=1 Tax=Paspalum notatum var. saurae TaxID=547442 RepID=A0AAQ3USB1_PASNO
MATRRAATKREEEEAMSEKKMVEVIHRVARTLNLKKIVARGGVWRRRGKRQRRRRVVGFMGLEIERGRRLGGLNPRSPRWSEAVNVNEEVGRFFQTKKGLRQGDPLSPLLFNMVADMLATLIKRAKLDGQIRGIVPHLVDGGLSILQYADDTIIFLDHDLEMARNMKLLLCAFEQLFGLKINFNKSEASDQYMEIFNCKNGEFPFSYLGIPIHFKKLRNADWKKVEERFEKCLSSWKGKHLSIGGRLTLINSVLSSLPMYTMSFFDVPKGVIRKLDYFRSRFFWQGDEHKKKNIVWLSGASSANLKIKGVLGFMSQVPKTSLYLVNGYINFLPLMGGNS